MNFHLADGTVIPTVTAEQMLEVDRLAVEKHRLGILQMMENAGRNMSEQVMTELGASGGHVVVTVAAACAAPGTCTTMTSP